MFRYFCSSPLSVDNCPKLLLVLWREKSENRKETKATYPAKLASYYGSVQRYTSRVTTTVAQRRLRRFFAASSTAPAAADLPWTRTHACMETFFKRQQESLLLSKPILLNIFLAQEQFTTELVNRYRQSLVYLLGFLGQLMKFSVFFAYSRYNT